MVIFQCTLCGDTAKAELQALGFSYESNKDAPSMFNVPTHPFTVTLPNYWTSLLMGGKIVIVCPYCPKAVT